MSEMNFTLEQQKAIQTNSTKALVLAGAGSGKTTVITERVFHLLDQNVSPFEILVITFTRKAAQEMKQRIDARVGSAFTSQMFVGTFHAWCLDYLLRYQDVRTVLSQPEEEILIKQVAQDLGIYNGKKWKGLKKKDIDSIFFHYYNFGWQEEDLIGDGLVVFQEFMRRCRESKMVTYGMILTEFDKHKPCFRFDYKHILIDEVQDLNETQWQILNDFWQNASLFCVGDVDQSIYEWRGANPAHILLDLDDFDLFYVGKNFRSGENIVRAANSLITHNEQRIEKTMYPAVPGGKVWTHLPDKDSEALAELLMDNDLPKPVCVLARTHFLLTKLSQILDSKEYPHLYVGRGITNLNEWIKVHAYMKLFVNPYDNFSFMILADDLIGDKIGYAKIREQAIKNQQSHFQQWLGSEYRDRCTIFDLACGSDMMLDDLLKYMKDFFYRREQCFMEAVIDMIYEKYLHLFWRSKESPTVEEYLRHIALADEQDNITPLDDNALYLMTIHASKGLEFSTVVVAGLNEGIFPVRNGNIEEERRLLYVAMTRAKYTLILTSRPEQTETDGRVYRNPVSRFMSEIKVG